jgi:uncharacterized protein YhbP (UPF0306 family)
MADFLKMDPDSPEAYRNQALTMLDHQKTMVLAVNIDNAPWVAPVYFIYIQPGIYFFSSPRSMHIQALRECRQTAGAIYAESDRWQHIHGLQMTGRVEEILSLPEKLRITTRYLIKFPFARELMSAELDRIGKLSQKVSLYVFRPTETHCTDNRLGFGRRVRIEL